MLDGGTKRFVWIQGLIAFGFLLVQLLCLCGCRQDSLSHSPEELRLTLQKEKSMIFNKLTSEEERVIVHKGTEPPFSGKYYMNKESGSYLCRRCDAPLFRSSDKFDSGTGWPSFDDAIEGAVQQIPDPDGRRTEIVCAHCGAHLGHVFFSEGITVKNLRHCVNSLSLNFIPEAYASTKLQKAIFAGGCFWGVEYHFSKVKGVLSVKSGYTGGMTDHPSYQQVCTGKTGHAEAVEIAFDPDKVSYETLAKLFFEIHDPTEINRQGPDIGTQYRSAVFYANEAQKRVIDKLIALLKTKGYHVVTSVEKAGTFWEAEAYHQEYYKKNGHQPYCHIYQKRF